MKWNEAEHNGIKYKVIIPVFEYFYWRTIKSYSGYI